MTNIDGSARYVLDPSGYTMNPNDPIFREALLDRSLLESRSIYADSLEEQGIPWGKFLRYQLELESGNTDKESRRKAFEFSWAFQLEQVLSLIHI